MRLTYVNANMCKACRLISPVAKHAQACASSYCVMHMTGAGGVRLREAPYNSYARMPARCGCARPRPSNLAPRARQPTPTRPCAGDKPEAAHAAAAAELRALGHGCTLEYVAQAAGAVLAATGLLPHVNAGVMGEPDLLRLRRVSASQVRCRAAGACGPRDFAAGTGEAMRGAGGACLPDRRGWRACPLRQGTTCGSA